MSEIDINLIYETLLSAGIVSSQYDFDSQFLSRYPNHTAYLRSTGSSPSPETLLHLHLNLEAYKEIIPMTDSRNSLIENLSSYVLCYLKNYVASENELLNEVRNSNLYYSSA